MKTCLSPEETLSPSVATSGQPPQPRLSALCSLRPRWPLWMAQITVVRWAWLLPLRVFSSFVRVRVCVRASFLPIAQRYPLPRMHHVLSRDTRWFLLVGGCRWCCCEHLCRHVFSCPLRREMPVGVELLGESFLWPTCESSGQINSWSWADGINRRTHGSG